MAVKGLGPENFREVLPMIRQISGQGVLHSSDRGPALLKANKQINRVTGTARHHVFEFTPISRVPLADLSVRQRDLVTALSEKGAAKVKNDEVLCRRR